MTGTSVTCAGKSRTKMKQKLAACWTAIDFTIVVLQCCVISKVQSYVTQKKLEKYFFFSKIRLDRI